MRRKLNIRFLFGLLLIIVLLGACLHLVHGFQEKRNAGALLSRADQAEKMGNLDEVEKYLSRYVVFRPDDAEAMGRYALLLDKRDATGTNRLRVLLVLDEALRRAPDASDALHQRIRRRAADLAMSPGLERYKEAEEHLRTLLKFTQDDGELEQRLGRCFEGSAPTARGTKVEERYRLATTFYEKSIEHAPDQIEAYVRLAGLQRGHFNDPAGADETVQRMIEGSEKVPRSPKVQAEAHLARAQYFTSNGISGAADDVDRARKLAPDEADVLLAAAESALSKNDLDGARKLLERGVGLYPKELRMYHALASIEDQAGRFDEAAKTLTLGLKALPAGNQLRWELAYLMIRMGKSKEASELIALLRKEARVSQPIVDYLEAQLLLSKGQRIEGVRLLERAEALMKTIPGQANLTANAGLLLAQNYEHLGNPERQLAASRRVLDYDPLSIPARLNQATAELALGHADQALAAYRAIAPKLPAAQATVARLLIARNLRLPEEERRWPEVDQAIDEAARAIPESIDVAILRADALAARGQLDQARDLLQQTRDKHPKQVAPWIALANLAGRRSKSQAVLSVLDDAQEQLGDSVELRLARIGYWSQHGGKEARGALQAMTRDSDTRSGDDEIRLKDALATAFARLGNADDLKEAQRLWTWVFDHRPDDLRVAFHLLELAFQTGAGRADDGSMQRAVERLRRIEGEDGALWRYGEAARLTLLGIGGDPRRFDEARVMLIAVEKRRPEWPRVPLLEARIAELQKNPERVVDAYLRAIERGERSPSVIRGAVELLNARGRSSEADRLVQKMLEQAPLGGTGTLGQLAAEMALRHKDQPRTLELASRAVAPDSSDYRDHLWLGKIYWATGRKVESGEALHRAVTLAGDNLAVWGPYINYLARTKPADRPPSLKEVGAEQAIEEARRQLPPEQATLVQAEGYAVMGLADRAEQQYQAALKAKPDDVALLEALASFYIRSGQRPKAEEYLNRILDPRTKASEVQVAWARRQQAIGVASQGGYQKIQKALAMIDSNLKAHRDSVEDRRLKALLLGMQPGGRPAAIRVYEDLERQQPPSAGEKFLVARLYEASGNWPKARELIRSVLAEEEDNTACLAWFTRSLLIHGEPGEAQPWLARLEKLQPQSDQTIELKARLLVSQGKGNEAAALIKEFTKDKDDLLGPFANLLRELGQFDASEEMYRDAVGRSKRPEANLALAGFLARRGRLSEALDLCDQAWQTCDPEKVGGASVAAIYLVKPENTQIQRVQTRLEEATRKHPDSIPLLFDLANVHIFRGNYQEAETLCRRMHEQNQSNIAVLNNLAWVLTAAEGKGPEALTAIGKAIDLAGPRPSLLDTRALAHMAMGRSDLAIQDLETAIATSPSPIMYMHLAQAKLMAKDRTAAQSAIEKAKLAGLNIESLHPLDRKSYESLLGEIERR